MTSDSNNMRIRLRTYITQDKGISSSYRMQKLLPIGIELEDTPLLRFLVRTRKHSKRVYGYSQLGNAVEVYIELSRLEYNVMLSEVEGNDVPLYYYIRH